jgi:hypothetical protein
VPI